MGAQAKLPPHIKGLLEYLSVPKEAANADLIRNYFRYNYPNKFVCESEAQNADGYVPGHYVLELKGKNKDWFSGLLQGLSYKRHLDFTLVIVAAHEFLAVWDVKDIPAEILQSIHDSTAAPNTIGKKLSTVYKSKKNLILKKASWKGDELFGLFSQDAELVKQQIFQFEKTIEKARKVRQKITTQNFTKVLLKMIPYFSKPIKAAAAFYSMIYGWNEGSILQISHKAPDLATLNGEPIKFLIPGKRIRFKDFVENHYIELSKNEIIDDFFAKYDRALDVVDKDFRIKHGIYFTDLDLSKFVIWFVTQKIKKDSDKDLGKDYLVIDPACGSGNLVTNWRCPLELRHKVVSDIEPELLFTVENRMKRDSWHDGKYTVIPKVEEGKGLNFLDKSADEYLTIIKSYLQEKGKKANKPIAFLCNPPYRGDKDQTASRIDYKIHPDIIHVIGQDAIAERYNCFLAQMKLICDKAEDIGIPKDSLLLIFTKTSWLTDRPSFVQLRKTIFSSFDYEDGILFNSSEFFDIKGKFPIAFTLWRYKREKKKKNSENPQIILRDLTWLTKNDLAKLTWPICTDDESSEYKVLDAECNKVLENKKSINVSYSDIRIPIKQWLDQTMTCFIRDRRKNEIDDFETGGLPKNDLRLKNKKTYGERGGEIIGFMDDVTPCRIPRGQQDYPWCRLDPLFMDCRRIRCFSGPLHVMSYAATNIQSLDKISFWFALGKVFSQCGYPMWADAFELWAPKIPNYLKEIVSKYQYALLFSDNECVETIFPANNPIKGAPEVYVSNPMAPTNPQSFWSTMMSPIFKENDSSLPDQLVNAVNDIYNEWRKIFKNSPEIIAPFTKPYFIAEGFLKETSGIIQIKDYAEAVNDEKLLNLHKRVRELSNKTKQSFYELLLDENGLNYFGKSSNSKIKNLPKTEVVVKESTRKTSKFDKILEKRVVLSGLIVGALNQDPNFGRTKLTKLFYLADVDNDLNLETNYFREAAGPLDQRALYNKKIGIEHLGEKYDYFTTKTEPGKNIRYIIGGNIKESNNKAISLFGNKLDGIKKIINLCSKMDTRQAEILATLYACWNDILLDKRECNDEAIIREFLQSWHHKKRRCSKERLLKALGWMKKHDLIPSGKNKRTHTKTKQKSEDDLF